MSDQHSSISADQFHPDPYAQVRIAERTLNAAIVHADISRSFEEYLEIFDRFYGDDIEVSGETQKEPIRGKTRVGSLLLNFLIPLHVVAEVGGLSISIRENTIPGDVAGITNSSWTLDLVAVSGKTCTISWRTFRKWNGARVVLERHYDGRQSGGPLTFDDFSIDAAELFGGFQMSS
jgi:hypothetical protein